MTRTGLAVRRFQFFLSKIIWIWRRRCNPRELVCLDFKCIHFFVEKKRSLLNNGLGEERPTKFSRRSSPASSPSPAHTPSSTHSAPITMDEVNGALGHSMASLTLVTNDPRMHAEKVRRKLPARLRSLPVVKSVPAAPVVPENFMPRVFVFGTGEQAELGLGDEMLLRKRPMPLLAVDGCRPALIGTGGQTGFVAGENGELYSWGTSDSYALGRPTLENWKNMAQVLRRQGRLSESKSLEAMHEQLVTEFVPGHVHHPDLDALRVVKFACGDAFSVLLTEIGTVYQCGMFRFGEGNIESSTLTEFTLIQGLEQHSVVDIAAGANHVLAVTDRGIVFSWGNGDQSQFGRRVSQRRHVAQARLNIGIHPERVPLDAPIVSVGAGDYHSLAVSQSGELYAWGMNTFGQLFFGQGESDFISLPQRVTALENVRIVSATGGAKHSLAVSDSGQVYSVGRCDSGQLGIPDNVRLATQEHNQATQSGAVYVPCQVTGIPGRVIQISSATDHNIAVCEDGSAYTWGYGDQCALGTGGEDDEFQPVRLQGQKLEGWHVVQGVAEGQHTFVLAVQPNPATNGA